MREEDPIPVDPSDDDRYHGDDRDPEALPQPSRRGSHEPPDGSADQPDAWAWFPTVQEVRDTNRIVHEDDGFPERFELYSPGFVAHAIDCARAAYESNPSDDGVLEAAGQLACLLAGAQAFLDGNRRTAWIVVQTFLANNGLAHISPVGKEDHSLARRLNRVVEHGDRTPADFTALFRRRYRRRKPQRLT